jgi:hypothetical protein
MTAATNLSATRRTLRALRRAQRLTDVHAALATLAVSTARALDDVLAGSERRYVIAQIARAHQLALEALLAAPEPTAPDAIEQLLAEIMHPDAGSFATPDDRMQASP